MQEAWADDAKFLEEIAREQYDRDWLQRWWRKKYNKPSKDPLLSKYTAEELLVEYLEDQIDQHGGFDEFAHATAKDKLSEEWNRKLDAGEEVDLLASLPEDVRGEVEKFAKRNVAPSPPAAAPSLPDEFSDDYTKDGA